jgi:hypothetical protein
MGFTPPLDFLLCIRHQNKIVRPNNSNKHGNRNEKEKKDQPEHQIQQKDDKEIENQPAWPRCRSNKKNKPNTEKPR